MASLRVVLDTNVFISTFLLHGRSTTLAQLLFDDRFALFVSEPILLEYFEVATRPRFQATREEVRDLLQQLAPRLHLVHRPQPIRLPRLRDPDDLKFIECALAGRARYLVTGDEDLLTLERYQRLLIVSIRDFLAALEG